MPFHDPVRVLPVILERLTLDREYRHARFCDGRRGMILGRKNITGSPAHFGTESNQGFDQYRSLNGHVQRARNTGAFQWLVLAVFITQGYESGHFGLGDSDFLATPGSKAKVCDCEILFENVLGVGTHK